MIPAHAVGRRDEHFERGVAGAGAHAGQAGVDAVAAFLDRDDRVGHSQAQVMVGMHAGLRFRLEHVLEGAEALAHVVHAERAARVHHVAHSGAVALHQLGLLGQALRRGQVAHHQETDRFHAQVARVLDVLARDVGFGAMGRHPDDARAGIVGRFQVVHGADAGQEQGGDLCVLHHAGHRLDPLEVGMGAEAVVEAAALQAVAVGDLDRIDLRFVEGARDLLGLFDAVLVADRMAAVAQRHVRNIDFRVHACCPSGGQGRGGEHACGHAFGRAQGCAGHDVQVAGIGGQVVGGALDFQEDRGLQAGH
jgi:hypothetical protein